MARRIPPQSGAIDSVTGTAGRIAVTGTASDPIINIDATFVGQSSITTLGTITTGTWNGTDIAVADGGTGAGTAAGARTNLGLVIGTDIQAYDAGLQSISGLTTAADKMIYTTASDTYAVTDLTTQARALLDDTTQLAQAQTILNNVGVTAATVAGTDKILGLDVDDSGNLKSFTAQSIADLGGGGGGTRTATEVDVSPATHGFAVGDALYHNGTAYVIADASSATTADVLGVVSAVPDVNNFTLTTEGEITGLTGLTAGSTMFLTTTGTTGNTLSATDPTAIGEVNKPVIQAISTTAGFVVPSRGVVIGGAGSSPGMVLLGTESVSGGASLDMNNYFNGTYSSYKIFVTGIRPGTDQTELWLRAGTGATPTYHSGASDYAWTQRAWPLSDDISNADAQIGLYGDDALGNAAAESASYEITVHRPSDTNVNTLFRWDGVVNDAGSTAVCSYSVGAGAYLATTAVTSAKILMSSGTITAEAKIYGIRG